MERRKALKTLTLATGGGIILPATLFTTCQSEGYRPIFFTKRDIILLNEIGETILPETKDSPGAKKLKIANFMDVYVADCYTPNDQQLLQNGLLKFEKDCQTMNGHTFMEMTATQRHDFLIMQIEEAKKKEGPHYFTLLKSLVLFAYFTSKEGATQALRYLPIPGKYEGNFPLQVGDKSWALG